VHTHYYYIVRTTRERSTNAMKCCVELFHFSISILIIGFLFVVCRCYARLHPRAVNCRKRSCGHTNQVSSTIPNLLIQQCCAPPNLLQQQQIILSLSLVTHTHSLLFVPIAPPQEEAQISYLPMPMGAAYLEIKLCSYTSLYPLVSVVLL
jgi:hypothetical protein